MTATYFKSFHYIIEDPLFDDLLLEGVWHRLMTVADRMYPHAGVLPRSVPEVALERLEGAGRVVRQGPDHYRMPELDTEQEALTAAGKRAAGVRWNAGAMRPHDVRNAEPMPTRRDSLDETSLEETLPAVDLQRASARDAKSFQAAKDEGTTRPDGEFATAPATAGVSPREAVSSRADGRGSTAGLLTPTHRHEKAIHPGEPRSRRPSVAEAAARAADREVDQASRLGDMLSDYRSSRPQ